VEPIDWAARKRTIAEAAARLGFSAMRVAEPDLSACEAGLLAWLEAGFHGEMDYMRRHGLLRARPAELLPGTVRVITLRFPYWPEHAAPAQEVLADPRLGYVSRYALGRDYHKAVRARLAKLIASMEAMGPHRGRAFVDSAPVMEVALAERAGLGWRGKHTLLLSREEGSFFFLGEIFTDWPLPVDAPVDAHCGRCTRCLDLCPTRAIVAPYQLDARRCISYLTIEHPGPIPEALRPMIGNRIYGCDDCQLVCPWNRFARRVDVPEFMPRHGLDAPALTALFSWSEAEFLEKFAGSPIRRIGWERWLRNLAVALGNAPPSAEGVAALMARREHPSALVREHVAWALARHGAS